MNGAEKQSGLCEGKRERVGHFGQIHGSWLAQVIICAFPRGRIRVRVVVRNAGSDLIRLSRVPTRRGGVSGDSTQVPLFLGLPFSACALARPQGLLWIGHIRPSFPSPPPPLISFASVELLAS